MNHIQSRYLSLRSRNINQVTHGGHIQTTTRITIDSCNRIPSNTSRCIFSVSLAEPITINELSDVYLSNIRVGYVNGCRRREELGVDTPIPRILSIDIPQFTGEAADIASNEDSRFKLNILSLADIITARSGSDIINISDETYYCTITPRTFRNFDITITNQDGEGIFSSGSSNRRVMIQFTIRART